MDRKRLGTEGAAAACRASPWSAATALTAITAAYPPYRSKLIQAFPPEFVTQAVAKGIFGGEFDFSKMNFIGEGEAGEDEALRPPGHRSNRRRRFRSG